MGVSERVPPSLPMLTSRCQIIILSSFQAAGNGVLVFTGKVQQSLSASEAYEWGTGGGLGVGWENRGQQMQGPHSYYGNTSPFNLVRRECFKRTFYQETQERIRTIHKWG